MQLVPFRNVSLLVDQVVGLVNQLLGFRRQRNIGNNDFGTSLSSAFAEFEVDAWTSLDLLKFD